jgi:hypothetical protein
MDVSTSAHALSQITNPGLCNLGCVESSFPLVKLGDVTAASANAMVMNTIVCFMLNDGR